MANWWETPGYDMSRDAVVRGGVRPPDTPPGWWDEMLGPDRWSPSRGLAMPGEGVATVTISEPPPREPWPVRFAGDMWETAKALPGVMIDAATLPGDVMAGRIDPNSDDALARVNDLAGVVTLKAGAIPGGGLRAGLGSKAAKAAADEPAGIRVYHGSPHDFDKFSMEKIGTGEGAQSYGHGLYFAENPSVAESYKASSYADRHPVLVGGVRVDMDSLPPNSPEFWAAKSIQHAATTAGGKAIDIDKLRSQWANDKTSDLGGKVAVVLSDWEQRGISSGRMYEARLNASPDEFLDWDKPLSEQPALIQEIARTADLSHLKPGNRTRRQIEMWREGKLANPADEPTGNVLHNALTDYGTNTVDNAALTEKLRAAGIKGIRYLDQGSRGAGAGTSNYVVFDDNIIDILRKYGIAGLIGGAAGAGAMLQPGQAEASPIDWRALTDWLAEQPGAVSRDALAEAAERYSTGDIPRRADGGRTSKFRERIMKTGRPSKNVEDMRASQSAKINIAGKGNRELSRADMLRELMRPESIVDRPIDDMSGGWPWPSPEWQGGMYPRQDQIYPAVPSGLIRDATPGRTDRLPMSLPSDTYVVPADVVSGLGQGNTEAGGRLLDTMFRDHKSAGGRLRASGGRASSSPVQIIAAGGEYLIDPEVVYSLGKGDPDKGHKELDKWVRATRQRVVNHMTKLPGPRKD